MRTVSRHIVLFLLALSSSNTGWAQETPDTTNLSRQIDQLLGPVAEAELFSGIVLVARGDEIMYHEAFGYSDWELKAPLARTSRLGVGSLTKQMTDTIVELLMEEGRLDLKVPVEQYIEDFPAGPEGGIATVEHLYRHRSGVPHRVTTDLEEAQGLATNDIVDRVKRQGLLFEPGSERLYSSAGYTVLARIIEIIEDKPFDRVVRERVFEPAGMAHATSETGRELMTGRASPYILGSHDGDLAVLNAPFKDLRFLTGAGSLYMSAEDLFHYVLAMREGVFGSDFWDEMVDAEASTWRGWTGWTSGYEAYLDVLPGQDLTLVLLTNLRSMITWQTRQAIRTLLEGGHVEPFIIPPPPSRLFESFAEVVGKYSRNGSVVEIRLEEGRLFRGDNEMYPVDGNRYFTPASGSIVVFRRNSEGDVDALLSPPNTDNAMLRIE